MQLIFYRIFHIYDLGRVEKFMAKNNSTDKGQLVETKLNRSLKLIYVYAIAAGAIFTFIGYWDSIFYEYCGPGTFLAFLLMTLLILPIAFVYCEMAPMFPKAGGELIYNTVGINKHFGFLSAWLIMAAWIAVPPAAIMAIVQWIFRITGMDSNFTVIEVVAAVLLIGYFILSLQNVEIAGKIQLVMLVLAASGCIIASIAFMCTPSWSLSNFSNFFNSQAKPALGIPRWIIGLGFLITPFFGFETVPQMIEEGDFPIKDSSKAIWGSVVTCGLVYTFFFIGLGGMPIQSYVTEGGAATKGFLAISLMEQLGGGWRVGAIFFGVCAILCAIGTCLLGFWLSTVRLLYAMGRSNFLPESFAKLNKHQQPILPLPLIKSRYNSKGNTDN
jgi:APA family basic amino acid/polyamine antiporter